MKNQLLRLQAVVEASQTGLGVVDQGGRIILVNREIERLFGYSREELLGTSVDTLVPDGARDAHSGFREAFMREPRERAMGAGRELHGRRKDGTHVPIEIGLTPVRTEDGLFAVVSIVDLTERKAAEARREEMELRLRQAQRLESLGRLAGGIAHDFNNVLATVLSISELAFDFPGAPAQLLDGILRATQRGRDLVERILVFSRGQAVALGPVPLGPTVSGAIDGLCSGLRAGIELSVRIAAPAPVVRSDASAIQLIVSNLVSNAVHATPGEGRVIIEVSRVDVDATAARSRPSLREGAYGRIVVRDAGIGMDPAMVQRCFEPFFTTKRTKSAGLGLAMVHGLVQDQGGSVWIDSALGHGTAVTVLIPMSRVRLV